MEFTTKDGRYVLATAFNRFDHKRFGYSSHLSELIECLDNVKFFQVIVYNFATL